ncbi:splicing factor, CC1-like protein [Gigaspora margarita]|uniref:Splicing factor, CC1-like protein n=1 Tax=Gigaspora margarita TaxID=4874 RepID=A0A8H4A9Z4_GIGMA|nr:splicing factor, CC1-like protein [Gigaspora margarita]
MADDLDVEAMLEAPFQKGQESSVTHNTNGKSRSDQKDDIKSDERRRHRSSSRTSSHRHRSHSRSRRSRKSRSRSRDKHKRHRSRSRSRDRRRRSRTRSRERRKRSRSTRRRSRSPSRFSDRERRRRSPTPPLDEEERDKRTVFVMQLAARLRTRELADFFSSAGKVRDAKIIADRISRRSKGVGYVEFYDEEAVPKALALTGQKLLGIPVIVQLTEAEKNRQARLAEQAASHATDIAYHRLYVGSVHFNLTEDDLRQVFEPFGPLEFVNLHKDPETGRSRGFAFIQYKNPEDAKQALEKMNGFELAGRTIKVGLVTDKSNGMNLNLDDGDVAGLALNAQSRVELMQKLARDTDLIAPASTPALSEVPRPVQPRVNPTRCVLLKNMFNPEEETESNWAEELEEDVKGECVKYGAVVHISVDKESEGDIYMKFDNVASAKNAVNGLNGRWFGGNQIQAVFILDMFYNARFPKAASL